MLLKGREFHLMRKEIGDCNVRRHADSHWNCTWGNEANERFIEWGGKNRETFM